MNIIWVNAEVKPDLNDLGISKQVVVKFKSGYLGTGFWYLEFNDWVVDGITIASDPVIEWLSGLEVAETAERNTLEEL